jgi:two-component system, NarL family, invasion response regulator UvrY
MDVFRDSPKDVFVEVELIRVLVVDDHEVVQAGVQRLLATTSDMRVTATATDAAGALARMDECDVVILDLHLGEASSLPLLDDVAPRRPVLVHSFDETGARESLSRGALGYVTKGSPAGVLLQALRCVARGDRYL